MKKEIWKEIEGYEKYYQISNIGRIRSFDRIVTVSKKYTVYRRLRPHRIIKQYITKAGYCIVKLYDDKKHKINAYVHRLVGNAFIENPFNLPCINHKNGIKDDNRKENLEWCSHADNLRHARRVLRSGNVKLSYKEAKEIRKMVANGVKQSDIMKMYKVCQATVSAISNNHRWV